MPNNEFERERGKLFSSSFSAETELYTFDKVDHTSYKCNVQQPPNRAPTGETMVCSIRFTNESCIMRRVQKFTQD